MPPMGARYSTRTLLQGVVRSYKHFCDRPQGCIAIAFNSKLEMSSILCHLTVLLRLLTLSRASQRFDRDDLGVGPPESVLLSHVTRF